MNSVSSAYKLGPRDRDPPPVEDAWKIKAGLDRGEYSVGIEGQKAASIPRWSPSSNRSPTTSSRAVRGRRPVSRHPDVEGTPRGRLREG